MVQVVVILLVQTYVACLITSGVSHLAETAYTLCGYGSVSPLIIEGLETQMTLWSPVNHLLVGAGHHKILPWLVVCLTVDISLCMVLIILQGLVVAAGYGG